jgi:hypothetical protein
MDPHKKHRELLLLEEYRMLSEKTNKLTGLIWYLTTGVYTFVGFALINIITEPLFIFDSFLISVTASFIIFLYLKVSNRWHEIIKLLYKRIDIIEERLDFYGNRSIGIRDKDKKGKINKVKRWRVIFSYFLFLVLVLFSISKVNCVKEYLYKIFNTPGLTQLHKISGETTNNKFNYDQNVILPIIKGTLSIIDNLNSTIELYNKNTKPEVEIRSSKKFKIYFSKGSLLVENNYLSNKKTIIEVTNYLKNIPVTSEYKAMIVGYSSIERINSNNHRVNNNYELSKARAENIKFFINELMLKNKNQLKNIEYFCGGFSNQKSLSHDINEQRKVEITFYEVSNVQAPQRD